MLATRQSFESTQHPCIGKDDLVVAYVSPKVMRAVYVQDNPDHVVQFVTGTYHTQDWIGKRFGCAVYPRKAREHVSPLYLLAPTPELWTRVLNHRTQILYLADISLICMFLELKPGSIVLESGTGSGSLTHALARAAAPSGHVHTFEFHQDRCNTAEEEFKKHGMVDVVTVMQRDVQQLGFPESFSQHVHGVFLDLPEPWKAIPSAVVCLLPGHCLVSFSPCIEQIQRTCQALTETEEVIDMRTMECISKEYRVKAENVTTDLAAYHQHKLHPQVTQSGSKRKESEPDEADGNSEVPETEKSTEKSVANARVVDLKGHTGFLVVGRKFAK